MLAAGTPAAAGAASSREAGAGRVVHYLSLGDSQTVSLPSFVDMVAKQAGAALHAKVPVTRVFEEGTVAALAERLPASKAAIRGSDLITVVIGVNQLAQAAFRASPGGCGSRDGLACIRKAERDFEQSYGPMLDALTRLRPVSKAAYRLLTEYDLPAVFQGAKRTAFSRELRNENRFVCSQARKRGMKCVDVYATFNGPNGGRDPQAAGLIRSDRHPTPKGAALIAKLVTDAGFAPLHP